MLRDESLGSKNPHIKEEIATGSSSLVVRPKK
jgi:hypothetical protein